MVTINDYIPCQLEPAPSIDQTLYKEVDRVNLQNLPEGTIVLFKGLHPASNYVIQVLGSNIDIEREVKLWYVGTSGPACFIGPKSGCFKTRAKNLASFTIGELFDKQDLEGVIKRGEQYQLPEFVWNPEGILSIHPRNFRLEAYTKIRIPTGLDE